MKTLFWSITAPMQMPRASHAALPPLDVAITRAVAHGNYQRPKWWQRLLRARKNR